MSLAHAVVHPEHPSDAPKSANGPNAKVCLPAYQLDPQATRADRRSIARHKQRSSTDKRHLPTGSASIHVCLPVSRLTRESLPPSALSLSRIPPSWPAMPTKRRNAPEGSSVAEEAEREELFRRKLARKHGTEPASPSKPKPSVSNEATAPCTPTKASKDTEAPQSFSESGIWVNRAPVLTLWVTKVAQRQGFSRDTGLTCGKRIAGEILTGVLKQLISCSCLWSEPSLFRGSMCARHGAGRFWAFGLAS